MSEWFLKPLSELNSFYPNYLLLFTRNSRSKFSEASVINLSSKLSPLVLFTSKISNFAPGSALLLNVYFITEVSWKPLLCRCGLRMESDRIYSQRWRYFLWRVLWRYQWWNFGCYKCDTAIWWQYQRTRILLGRPQLLFLDIYVDADQSATRASSIRITDPDHWNSTDEDNRLGWTKSWFRTLVIFKITS